MADERDHTLGQVLLETKVSDLLEAIGLDRSEHPRSYSTRSALMQLKNMGLVNYQPGINISSHLREQQLALLLISQTSTVCLYGSPKTEGVTRNLQGSDIYDETGLSGNEVRLGHISMTPEGLYTSGQARIITSFASSTAIWENSGLTLRVPQRFSSGLSPVQRFACWMKDERLRVLRREN